MIGLISSCRKTDIDDIMRTDTYGNIISRGESKDWTPVSVAGNNSFTEDLDNIQRSINLDVTNRGVTPFQIKRTCPQLPDSLEIYPYANPLANTDNLNIRIKSSVPICFFYYSYEGLNRGDGGGTAFGWSTQTWREGKKNMDFNVANTSVLFPKGDLKLTFYVVTVDSCVYRAGGYVMVQ